MKPHVKESGSNQEEFEEMFPCVGNKLTRHCDSCVSSPKHSVNDCVNDCFRSEDIRGNLNTYCCGHHL